MSSRKVRRRSRVACSETVPGLQRAHDRQDWLTELRVSRAVEVVQPAGESLDEVSGTSPAVTARLLASLVRIGCGQASPPGRLPFRWESRQRDTVPGDDVEQLTGLGLLRRVQARRGSAGRTGVRFVLTKAGQRILSQLSATLARLLKGTTPRPCWDPFRHELRLGRIVVKRFRRPAPNQELILAAFEELDWPERIDDPLPPSLQVDPRQRLHETIKSLNRVQAPILHFGGDGSGVGVRWSLQAGQPVACCTE